MLVSYLRIEKRELEAGGLALPGRNSVRLGSSPRAQWSASAACGLSAGILASRASPPSLLPGLRPIARTRGGAARVDADSGAQSRVECARPL